MKVNFIVSVANLRHHNSKFKIQSFNALLCNATINSEFRIPNSAFSQRALGLCGGGAGTVGDGEHLCEALGIERSAAVNQS